MMRVSWQHLRMNLKNSLVTYDGQQDRRRRSTQRRKLQAERVREYEILNRMLLARACVLAMLAAPPGRSQETNPKATPKAAASTPSARQQNMDEYIKLLRSDVRQQKAEMMGGDNGGECCRRSEILADL